VAAAVALVVVITFSASDDPFAVILLGSAVAGVVLVLCFVLYLLDDYRKGRR
jgi:uncharacterized integral membrane protein